jgi:hypothetical protein
VNRKRSSCSREHSFSAAQNPPQRGPQSLCGNLRICVGRGFSHDISPAMSVRLHRLRKNPSGVSFRAKRGISLRFKSKKREIPHPPERVRNDSFTRTYLINASRQISPLESALWRRANGAEDASPGQRLGYRAPDNIVRPERAERSCAPSGRQPIGRYRNPGCYPGLICAGAFSAGRC